MAVYNIEHYFKSLLPITNAKKSILLAKHYEKHFCCLFKLHI